MTDRVALAIGAAALAAYLIGCTKGGTVTVACTLAGVATAAFSFYRKR